MNDKDISWNPLGDIEEQADEATKARQELQNEFNKLHVRVFTTDDGKKLLEQYRSDLIDSPAFVPEMGFENGATLGFYREGQNSIIRQMTLRVKKGLEIQ